MIQKRITYSTYKLNYLHLFLFTHVRVYLDLSSIIPMRNDQVLCNICLLNTLNIYYYYYQPRGKRCVYTETHWKVFVVWLLKVTVRAHRLNSWTNVLVEIEKIIYFTVDGLKKKSVIFVKKKRIGRNLMRQSISLCITIFSRQWLRTVGVQTLILVP